MSRDVAAQNHPDPHVDRDSLVAWSREWGALLRSARQVAGLSLAGLSARTGLSRGYLSKLEAGQDGARNPSRATLAALANALPSFKPLAYQLEPASSHPAATIALAEEIAPSALTVASPVSVRYEIHERDSDTTERPIQLGWREFEGLIAFLALDRSAVSTPLSARLIARAVDRPVDDMRRTLGRLVENGALLARPPAWPGADITFGRGEKLERDLGLVRLGDALVLAAALLTQASTDRALSPRRESARAGEDEW